MKGIKAGVGVLVFLLAPQLGRATTAIANWDCVPYQVFNGTFKVGVVAFHETGVNVEILANGASLGTLTDPTYNDRTDVWEYWVELDAADYSDGEVRLSAIAMPDGSGHTARTLGELVLYANSGGSLTNSSVKWVDCDNGNDGAAGTEAAPYKTIEKGITAVGDGGTVYLKASRNYTLTSLYSTANYTYWTTVTAAPGVTRDQVHIAGDNAPGTSSGRYGDDMILWKNVAFYTDANPGGFHTIFYINNGQKCWFEEVEMYDANGRWTGGGEAFNNQGGQIWVTNSYIHSLGNGVGGLRNNLNSDICSDIYRPGNNLLSVNLTVDGIDPGTTGAHPDFWQCYCTDGYKENAILYNCRAYNMTAQGIFGCNNGCGLRDVAMVNVLLEKDPPGSYLISQTGYMEHTLIWHFTTVDQGWIFPDPATVIGWDVKDCNFAGFNAAEATNLSNSSISHNHFASLAWNQPQPMGTNATQGDQAFADTAKDDYRITSASPCYQSGLPLPGVPVDIDGVPYDAVSPNRGCFAAANNSGLRYFKNTPVTPYTIRIAPNPIHLKRGGGLTVNVSLTQGPETVILELYTMQGHKAGTAASRQLVIGWPAVHWRPEGLKSGMYQLAVRVGQSVSLYPIMIIY